MSEPRLRVTLTLFEARLLCEAATLVGRNCASKYIPQGNERLDIATQFAAFSIERLRNAGRRLNDAIARQASRRAHT